MIICWLMTSYFEQLAPDHYLSELPDLAIGKSTDA